MVESSTQTSWCCTGAASMSSQKKARGLPGMMIILLFVIVLTEVEMESLQFVGCSWFIGLIGLGFRFTQNKSTSTQVQCIRTPRVLTIL